MRNEHTYNEVYQILARTLQIPQKYRTTPFIWGGYGIGKSELVKAFAKEQSEILTKQYITDGRQDELFEITTNTGEKKLVAFDPEPVDIRLALKDAGDIQGLPMFNVDQHGVNRTAWAIPECFPSDPKWKGVIFLDELNLGQMAVINACYQILTEHRLNSILFNEGVLVVCAGNYTEIATNAIELPTGINTRVNHIDMTPNLGEWTQWAIENKVHPSLVSFLNTAHSDRFYDKEAVANDVREVATPRSWVRVGAFLSLPNYDWEKYLVQDITGIVGIQNATALKTYLDDASKYQSPDDVLVEGNLFQEDIHGFFNCFLSIIAKLDMMTDITNPIKNLKNATIQLKNEEWVAFIAKTILLNKKLHDKIIKTDVDFIKQLATKVRTIL